MFSGVFSERASCPGPALRFLSTHRCFGTASFPKETLCSVSSLASRACLFASTAGLPQVAVICLTLSQHFQGMFSALGRGNKGSHPRRSCRQPPDNAEQTRFFANMLSWLPSRGPGLRAGNAGGHPGAAPERGTGRRRAPGLPSHLEGARFLVWRFLGCCKPLIASRVRTELTLTGSPCLVHVAVKGGVLSGTCSLSSRFLTENLRPHLRLCDQRLPVWAGARALLEFGSVPHSARLKAAVLFLSAGQGVSAE